MSHLTLSLSFSLKLHPSIRRTSIVCPSPRISPLLLQLRRPHTSPFLGPPHPYPSSLSSPLPLHPLLVSTTSLFLRHSVSFPHPFPTLYGLSLPERVLICRLPSLDYARGVFGDSDVPGWLVLSLQKSNTVEDRDGSWTPGSPFRLLLRSGTRSRDLEDDNGCPEPNPTDPKVPGSGPEATGGLRGVVSSRAEGSGSLGVREDSSLFLGPESGFRR